MAAQTAAAALLDINLAVRRGETFLLVTDEAKPALITALAGACQQRGIAFESLVLREEEDYEPPERVSSALCTADAALLATRRSYTHSRACTRARALGARIATSPGVDEVVLFAGLAVDHAVIAAAATALADRLTRAGAVRLTSPAGTDLRFSLSGLEGHAETGLYTGNGDIGNLPAGEASIGFAAASASGVVVIDGSYPGLGRLTTSVALIVERGVAIRAEGTHAAFFERLWVEYGERARRLAEFGIGVNPGLQLCGLPLIDEKVAGTAHLGFGNDLNFGGVNDIHYHADGTLLQPSIEVDGVAWVS